MEDHLKVHPMSHKVPIRYLIWNLSLDLNICAVSLWSILVTSMSGHWSNKVKVEVEVFNETCMEMRALSVMENLSERFRPSVCFPLVKMLKATFVNGDHGLPRFLQKKHSYSPQSAPFACW